MAIKTTFWFAFLLLSISCSTPKLLLERKSYSGPDLRLDGYYYQYRWEYADGVLLKIVFFYENGVFLDGAAAFLRELNDREEVFSSGEYYNFAKEVRILWGVHSIKGGKIQYEHLLHRGGALKLDRILRTGEILNDTTFVITNVLIRGDVRYPRAVRDTFHFKAFSPKPDSTNVFIE